MACGYDPGLPTLVSWLGVTRYLGVDALRRAAAERGTSFATFFTPEEIDAALTAAGFREVEHLTVEQADARHFAGRTDGLHASVFERLVSARA